MNTIFVMSDYCDEHSSKLVKNSRIVGLIAINELNPKP